jgi:two-component system phosphate regulon sensor histidine kinase PhoR
MVQGQSPPRPRRSVQPAAGADPEATDGIGWRSRWGSRLGVRGKLFIVSLVLILLVGLASGGYLELQMRRWIGERVETELLRQAATAQQHVELVLRQADPDLDRLADRLGMASASRITLIAPDGWVAGDSELSPEQVASLENHGSRPEVLAARAGGRGLNRRFSTTLDTDMLYLAIALDSQPPGWVLRVSRPLAAVERAIRDLHLHLIFAGLLGLVIAVFMSGLASHLSTRTLRALVRHAHGSSRPQPAAPPPRGDEIQGLLGSFDELARALQLQMDRLARERDRSQAILDCMGEALFALDARQRVIMVNQAALDLLRLGRPPLGIRLSEITGVPALEATLAQASAGELIGTEFTLANPGPREILARAAPLRLSGGSVVVMHDITELRRMERSLRDFVANASHELRTPVSVIRANAETLADGAITDPGVAHQLVTTLERNAQRLVNIVTDLLDLSRLDAYQYQIQPERVRLKTALSACIDALAPLAAERKIELALEADPELWVLADPKGLDQILLNLADNALKYAPSGSRVLIRGSRREAGLRIEVVDSGPGIPPEHRERLFERFYRVDTARSRQTGGTGLGLAIVKTLAQAMHGTTGMEPNQPQGAIFWVQLPAAD